MQIVTTILLLSTYTTFLFVQAKPTGELTDSYAIAPQLDQTEDVPSDLNLDMAPPDVNAAPHIYYVNQDGMAEPADKPLRLVKREVAHGKGIDESLIADETVVVGPPSGRPFGIPAVQLGYRPGRAYYARRYHRYPWNYH